MKKFKILFVFVLLLLLANCSTTSYMFPKELSKVEFVGQKNGITIFCTISQFLQYDSYLNTVFVIHNGGNKPINLNYFADNFMIIDKYDKQYEISFKFSGSSGKDYTLGYPANPINPGNMFTFGGEKLYTSLNPENIERIKIFLGIEGVKLELIPDK